MRTTIKRFILLSLLSALACGCAEEDSCQEKMCEMRDIVAPRAPLNAYGERRAEEKVKQVK